MITKFRIIGCLVFTFAFLTINHASAAYSVQSGYMLNVYVFSDDEITWIEENPFQYGATDVWTYGVDSNGWKSWRKEGTFYGVTYVHVHGSNEDDVITCHALNWYATSRISAGEGNDVLYGSSSADYLFGGPGNDLIYGNDGGDSIFGGWGNDRLFGNWGRDGLWGGDGSDYLDGGNDGLDDVLRGHQGRDVFINYLDFEYWWHDQDTFEDFEENYDRFYEYRNY